MVSRYCNGLIIPVAVCMFVYTTGNGFRCGKESKCACTVFFCVLNVPFFIYNVTVKPHLHVLEVY